MIHLIKDSCLNQLQLETILDTPIKLSQLIKNKGKKLLNDDLKMDAQAKVLRYLLNYLKYNVFFLKICQHYGEVGFYFSSPHHSPVY